MNPGLQVEQVVALKQLSQDGSQLLHVAVFESKKKLFEQRQVPSA